MSDQNHIFLKVFATLFTIGVFGHSWDDSTSSNYTDPWYFSFTSLFHLIAVSTVLFALWTRP